MIGFIVFGLVVGALARLVLPGKQHLSIIATLLIGIVGSVIGGVVASALGTGDAFELNILGSIVAVISAAVLIAIIDRGVASRSRV
ncbi:MAG: GlsB/YeaQ/YmgE family stress response membrane protein [Acidimicrobiia bacterium]|nr:GlsB/YeaQ/YmgE family stress response membrane protein [Acidimicrobiia bacterium]